MAIHVHIGSESFPIKILYIVLTTTINFVCPIEVKNGSIKIGYDKKKAGRGGGGGWR